MTDHKYLGDSKMFEYDKHYRECQQSNKPFIKSRINPSHGNFFVQIDLMTCNYNLSELDQKEIQQLIHDEIKFVKSNQICNLMILTSIRRLLGLMVYLLIMCIIFVKVCMI